MAGALSDQEQDELQSYLGRIRKTDLADLQTLVAAGGGMGVFRLATPIIDALASAHAGRGGSRAWDMFVPKYLYSDLVGRYGSFRSLGVHNLSAEGVAFVSGLQDVARHRTEFGGILVLHAETFATDVETAFERFTEDAMADANIGARALGWFRSRPPVGGMPFAIGSAASLSAAGAPTVAEMRSFRGERNKDRPKDRPKTAIPGKRKKKRPR